MQLLATETLYETPREQCLCVRVTLLKCLFECSNGCYNQRLLSRLWRMVVWGGVRSSLLFVAFAHLACITKPRPFLRGQSEP